MDLLFAAGLVCLNFTMFLSAIDLTLAIRHGNSKLHEAITLPSLITFFLGPNSTEPCLNGLFLNQLNEHLGGTPGILLICDSKELLIPEKWAVRAKGA